MKKYKLIFPLAVLVMLCACNKSYDPKVYSSLTSDNAFLTRSDAIAAVNAVYARLKGPSAGDNFQYWTVGHFRLTDMTTDIGHSMYRDDISYALWNATTGTFMEEWRLMYKCAADANNAIFNISKMTSISNAEKAQFLSEIKFVRALAYTDLTDAFGPVIFVTEENVGDEVTGQPNPTPVEEIQAAMLKDLETCAATLPVNYQNNAIYAGNDVGRATKGAALTLAARISLNQHNWQKAADLTQQVIGLNQYSLHPSYAGLFAENNKWCEENIFSVLADANTNGTELLNHFGPINFPTGALKDRWQYFAASWDFYHTFDDADDRKKMFYPNYLNVRGNTQKEPPSIGATAPPGVEYLPDVAIKKYADSLGSTTYYDGHCVPVLRYADVKLMRAEALNELNGPSSEAITLINDVKGRSHAPLLSVAGLTKETLRDAILQERGWELFYEGTRRQDLIRMNKYDVMVNAYLQRIGQSATIKMPNDKYFPYPQTQVDLNPNLSNAGRR